METCMRCGRILSRDSFDDYFGEYAYSLCDRCAGEQILERGGCCSRFGVISAMPAGVGRPGGQLKGREK